MYSNIVEECILVSLLDRCMSSSSISVYNSYRRTVSSPKFYFKHDLIHVFNPRYFVAVLAEF